MDILYIIGTGSKWNHNELRFSLRSIEKYGLGVDRIIISGYCPDFIDHAKVIYVPCDDRYDCAHKNILYKTITAINTLGLDKPIWISSDDHFYIKYVDFGVPKVWYRYEEIPRTKHKGTYFYSLRDTKEFLLSHNLPVYQTNPHCNTLFDIETFNKNRELFYKSFNTDYGIEMNCLMGNLLIKKGFEPSKFNDAKLKSESVSSLSEMRNRTQCISCYDTVADSWIPKALAEEFPEYSSYERPTRLNYNISVATTIDSWKK